MQNDPQSSTRSLALLPTADAPSCVNFIHIKRAMHQ